MKYFFLSEGWTIGRVWESTGLWNEAAWRRRPQIHRIELCIVEQGEKLWLYQVEMPVLMVEVRPIEGVPHASDGQSIGQVVLRRLITAEQAIERLCKAEAVLHPRPQT